VKSNEGHKFSFIHSLGSYQQAYPQALWTGENYPAKTGFLRIGRQDGTGITAAANGLRSTQTGVFCFNC
jgi:hypothetical protein